MPVQIDQAVFNITPAQAWQLGHRAARLGYEPVDNPYAHNTRAWREWRDGFTAFSRVDNGEAT